MPIFKWFFGTIPGSIVFGAIIITIGILISGGVIKFQKPNSAQVAGVTAPTTAAPQAPTGGPVKVATGNDPVLGDKNAPVTIIEFSDYECPFCKSYFTQTAPQIISNFVSTGKVKMVYRDLPLSFHQNAQKEAEAARCARDQGGDNTYFKFHDEVFTKTTSNGTGLALDQLPIIAKGLGLNVDQFNQCLSSNKYAQAVKDDLAYAAQVGANGTPTFYIGKSDPSGTINGTQIIGAQPYATFQAAIEAALK